MGTLAHRASSLRNKKEITYHAVYHHYRKWSRDGRLERVFQQSILSICELIDTPHLNLDGSHAPAKKGGEALAAYQGQKKAKTSNVLPLTAPYEFTLGAANGNR